MKTPGKKTFTSLKNLSKEKKLKELQFKKIHHIVVTKGELCRFGIKPDDDCIYCGEKDSNDHSFKDCQLVISFDAEVMNWINARNNLKFNTSTFWPRQGFA